MQHRLVVEVQPARPGRSAVYRNPKAKDALVNSYSPQITNVQQLWTDAVKKYSDKPCFGSFYEKQIKSKTYAEVDARVHATAAMLLADGYIGLTEEDGTQFKTVGICSRNREEWMEVDLACCYLGATVVPLYQTLKRDGLEHGINVTQLTTVFCSASSAKQLVLVQSKTLKNLVLFDPVQPQLLKQIQDRGLAVHDYNTQQAKHAGKKVSPEKVSPKSTYTLCFTSGSTGLPKVAKENHDGIISNVAAVLAHESIARPAGVDQDRYLSYLPLPHVFQRLVMLFMLTQGAHIVFSRGDILKITDQMQVFKPTIWISVPRILNRLYQKINDGFFKNAPADSPARRALEGKLHHLATTGQYSHPELDKAFAPARAILGGCVSRIITGSAPISAQVLNFLKVAFCCSLVQGYGQTQTYAASFLTPKITRLAGVVGQVTISTEFMLEDIPEMNYKSTDTNEKGELVPRGEICMRGAVIPGYFKDQERTKELIDGQGWLHTGDVGMLLPDGSLKIVDRKKNIFKLQQGQYIAPQKIENVIVQLGWPAEIYVHGDSLQSFCVAVATVEPAVLAKLNADLKVGAEGDLYSSVPLRKQLIKQIETHCRKLGLNGFQIPKNLLISSKPFVTLGIMTSTLKMQRFVAKKVFQKEIAELYKEGMLS